MRKEIVKFSDEMSFRDAGAIIEDGGFTVSGRMILDDGNYAVIEGDGLPEVCDTALIEVGITFVVDTYGRQKMTRIGSITPISRVDIVHTPIPIEITA